MVGRLWVALGLILAVAPAALAAGPPAGCVADLQAVERTAGIPAGLAASIAWAESGRADAVSGRVEPWPWTINVAGTGYFFASKQEAIAAVQFHRAQGVQSIDVGCMQINLMHHPAAFATLDDAFDPAANVRYGARFLQTLFAETRSWPDAVAAYHSRTPELGAAYAGRVLARWTGAPLGPLRRLAPEPAAQANHTPEFTRTLRDAADDHRQLLARVGRVDGAAPRRGGARGPTRLAALR